MKKIVNITLLIILFVFFMNNVVLATTIDEVITGMSGVGTVSANSKVTSVFNAIIKLIQVAGSGIALIVVTMLGIKYMTASANEKADLKKQAVPIIIGCVLLFAGSNIAAIIADLGNGFNS